MKNLLLNLFLLLISTHTLPAQTIYLVDAQKTTNSAATGVTTVDATAWNNACGNLQTAISAATVNDQVWVKAGNYEPAGAAATIIMKQGVQLYGHFAGTELQLSQRDLTIGANKTTLRGSGNVMQGFNLTNATILDGFTFTPRSSSTGNTRGLYLGNSSPVIRNCIFEGLRANPSGAAISNNNSSPAISDCIFRNNTAGFAGCISNSNGSPVFTNCKFLNNTGTAMYNDASTITLTNCTFDSNNWHSGAYGGALYNTYGTISTISGCTFTNNQNQGTFGGAIHDFESTSTIDNSTFAGNSTSGGGGAIANYGPGSSLTLNRCVIRNNSVTDASGGGIYTGGNLTAKNCFISNNTASGSGGGTVGGGNFINCVISGNSTASNGGGTFGGSFTNCVLAKNSAREYGGGTLSAGAITNTIIWGNSSELYPDNADILPGSSTFSHSYVDKGYAGEGSSSEDPKFVNINNPAGEDGVLGTFDDGLRLQNCSPALDGGTNENLVETTDILGQPRIYNNTVDPGPYEFQGATEIPPVITASGPLAICEGGSLLLSTPEGYQGTYLWSPGNATSQTLTVTTAGTYQVTITTSGGCTSTTAPVVVTVSDAPATPVITASGATELCPGSSVVLTNPDSGGTWTAKATPGNTPRANAVAFAIGNKGYMGTGINATGQNLKDFWEYDPESNIWMQKADFPGSARSVAAGFAMGNYGYIGTGFDGGHTKDFYQYDPANNLWTRKADFGGIARYKATGFSIGSKGYITLGYMPTGYSREIWEYNPANDNWTAKKPFPGNAREAAVGFSIGNAGYVGTGFLGGASQKDFYKYDQALDEWERKADFGGSARSYAVGFGIGTLGYLGTGSSTSDFWVYDPAADTWTEKASVPGTGKVGAIGFVIHGKGYLGTDTGTNKFYQYVPAPFYTWSTGASSPSITVNTAGSYTLTADNAGCSRTSAATTVSVDNIAAIPTLTIVQPTCAVITGSVTVEPDQNTTEGYTYALGTGQYQSANTFAGLSPGSYTVHVKSEGGCISSANFTINVALPPATPVVTASGPLAICPGGSVTLSAPAGYLSYLWSNGQTTNSIIVSQSGSYTVTISDERSCAATSAEVTVTETIPAVPVLTALQPTCSEPSGTITVENATAGYTYAIGSGAYQQNNAFANLPAGTYTVYLKTSNGCIASADATIVPSTISITANGPASFCTGGSVTLSAPAGYESYLWNTGENSSAITVSVSTDYTVTVTDASGCSQTSESFRVRAIPSVFYVDQNIVVPGDGSSWTNACKELRDAVTLAKTYGCISQIHVAAGTYKPTIGNSRDSTFAFYRSGLKIYGGYAPGGASRNVAANPTVLSGDVGIADDLLDNSYHVVVIAGLPASSDSLVFDGISVLDGNANGSDALVTLNNVGISPRSGGGVYVSGNAATVPLLLRNCKITDNNADSNGGGIYISQSPFAVTGSVLQDNNAAVGGALSAVAESLVTNEVTVSNSTFKSNDALNVGGAVVATYFPSKFTNCTFHSNSSRSASGAVYAVLAPARFYGCVFNDNTAPNGGTLFFARGELVIRNSTFNESIAADTGIKMLLIQEASGGIDNSIIWRSTTLDNPITLASSNSFVIRNSIVKGIGNGNNNLNTDPLFVNTSNHAGADGIFATADDGLRLQPCSPAINSGDDSFVPAELVTDLSGAARKYGSHTDLGAYEFVGKNVAESLLAANQEVSTEIIASGETVVFKTDGSDCKSLAEIQSVGSKPVTGNITAKVWVDTSQPSQFVKRHFEITPDDAQAASATARVTLYATDAEFAAFNSKSPVPQNLLPLSTDDATTRTARIANIQIEKRAGKSSDGTGEPSTYPGTATTITPSSADIVWNSTAERWEISFNVSGFSGFFIKTQSSPLPVRWVSVSASLNVENQPVIKWKVQETNVAVYAVQKSLDARSFESIGETDGIGDGLHQYSFVDNNVAEGTAYYRISQTDLDGTQTISRIVKLETKNTLPALSVYPIPAKNEVFVMVKSQKEEAEYNVTFTDVTGRNLKIQPLSPGSNKVDLRDLHSGIYLLRTSRGEVFKVIKE